MNTRIHTFTCCKKRESEERMSLRDWKCEIPSWQQYVLLHRPEQPLITYLTLASSFLSEAKICIKCTSSAKIWSCTCLHCLGVKGFPFVIVIAERGFPKVSDLLTVQWSFVLMSWEANHWALPDEWSQSPLLVEVWCGCSRSWPSWHT